MRAVIQNIFIQYKSKFRNSQGTSTLENHMKRKKRFKNIFRENPSVCGDPH